MEQISQIRQAYALLKEGDFSQADLLFESVVSSDPKNADALLGRLLVILKCGDESELAKQGRSFAKDPYFMAAYAAADDAMKARLDGYCAQVNTNAAEFRYQRAVEMMKNAANGQDYADAAYWFDTALQYVPGYKDAEHLKQQCMQQSARPIVQDELTAQEEAFDNSTSNEAPTRILTERPTEPGKKAAGKKQKKNFWNYLWLVLSLPFALLAITGFFTYDGSLADAAIFGITFVPAAMFMMLFLAPAGTPYLSATKKGLKKWHLLPITIRVMWLLFGLYLTYYVMLEAFVK